MKKSLPQPQTEICTSDVDSITVRGKDLSEELIGKVDFIEYFYFLLTGKEPTQEQLFFLNATLVAITEHGLVPSNQVARMTYASAPESFQAAIAAGLMGCGSVVFGSSQNCGELLAQLIEQEKSGAGTPDRIALDKLKTLRANKKPVPGFGHPQHINGDPRAQKLLALAKTHQVAGPHVQMLETLEKHIPEIYQRQLPINVSGAIPAVMLDVGFPPEALKGIPLLARTAGLIAHVYEEIQRPIGFLLSKHANQSAEYIGPDANEQKGGSK